MLNLSVLRCKSFFNMSITLQNITKYYGKQKAVDRVSFSIPSGQVVGFIGPNGAGKTTIMRIITGFLKADEGEVLVNNMDIKKYPLQVRNQIGYLPENNPLYYDMYVREFLDFVAGIHKLANRRAIIDQVIEMTGLTREQHKKIRQLSKGYKQRVGLAQAIIHNPPVLILDEPTSGLDPNQIIEIRNLISRLGKEKTVILSTHIMQEVEAICDRIIIINKGQIVADDTPNTIHERVKNPVMEFTVEFDSQLSPEQLKQIPYAEKIQSLGAKRWLITSREDIRKDIFDFAVKNNIAVLSLEMKQKSLEEIFHQLTTDKS